MEAIGLVSSTDDLKTCKKTKLNDNRGIEEHLTGLKIPHFWYKKQNNWHEALRKQKQR